MPPSKHWPLWEPTPLPGQVGVTQGGLGATSAVGLPGASCQHLAQPCTHCAECVWSRHCHMVAWTSSPCCAQCRLQHTRIWEQVELGKILTPQGRNHHTWKKSLTAANTGVGILVGPGLGEEAKFVLGVFPELHPLLGSSAASRKNWGVGKLSAQSRGEG